MRGIQSIIVWVSLVALGVNAAAGRSSSTAGNDDEAIVKAYVAKHSSETFRNASGMLQYPYQVPAGPYDQLWDWDSVFLGVATEGFGSREYFRGSMMNFLALTNTSTGDVKGCLTPSGASPTLYHAKPIIIQGAFLSAQGDAAALRSFETFRGQMEALLAYWERRPRRVASTGLHVWHDQLETGADNLVTSQCPSSLSPCWADSDSYTLVSADVMAFLHREYLAFAKFLRAWGDSKAAEEARHAAERVAKALETHLWSERSATYIALNVSDNNHQEIANRVYLMGMPLFARTANASQAAKVARELWRDDMMSAWGVRSTSSADARYSNENIIKPYSNWRGPVWINAGTMIAYGLNAYGEHERALELATRLVHTLAQDIVTTGTWHECYSSDTGIGLAAPGFLSWNTLGADLLHNIRNHIDPFLIEGEEQDRQDVQ